MTQKYLRTGDVMKMFNVTSKTVRKWADEGFITAIQLPSGQRRYDAASVASFAATLDIRKGATHG